MSADRKKQVVLLLLVVVIAGLLSIFGTAAADPFVEPIPPDDTYKELAAEWWQWAAILPADEDHPLIADGKVDCGLGQEGNVWFLGGTFAESGVANRECKVPGGKALFFPIVNVMCSPLTGDDPNTLLECAENPTVPEGFEFQMNPLFATIDGQDVGNLEDYYTLSEETFTITLPPPPNMFGTWQGATSGYYLLLPPLSKGWHEITFAGEIVVLDPGGEPVYYFVTEISYDLKVVGS